MTPVGREAFPYAVASAEMAWVPSGPGKAFRPLRFRARGWSELMRLDPGAEVALHRHTGAVESLVIEGRRLLSSGEILCPGGYQHEPAGTVDAWAATGTETCIVHLHIEGDIEYLESDGTVIRVVNSATQFAAYRTWCDANSATSLLPLDPAFDAPTVPGVPAKFYRRRISR